MNDEISRALTVLADEMPASDITEGAVSAGQQRRARRRSALAAGGTAIVVAAILVPLSLGSGHRSHLEIGTQHTVSQLGVPAPTDVEFDVAPISLPISEPLPPNFSKCGPSQITARAEMRRVAAGVVGVVALNGDTCALTSVRLVSLLAANGQRLSVPAINPGSPLYTFSFVYGTAVVGFAWDGSWCGQPAKAIRVSTHGGGFNVRLTGAGPPCDGSSASQFVPGVATSQGAPAEAAPVGWKHLKIALHVSRSTQGTTVSGLRATFTNDTSNPIALSPTPTYIVGTQDRLGEGTQSSVKAPLPLTSMGSIVPADGSITVNLPNATLSYMTHSGVGSPITVSFAIAGAPMAHATTTLDCSWKTSYAYVPRCS